MAHLAPRRLPPAVFSGVDRAAICLAIHPQKPVQKPVKICTYAFDQADQPSTLRVDLLKPR
jgi:hypothetical protein